MCRVVTTFFQRYPYMHSPFIVLALVVLVANTQAFDSTLAPVLMPMKPNLSKLSTTDTLHSLQTVPTYLNFNVD